MKRFFTIFIVVMLLINVSSLIVLFGRKDTNNNHNSTTEIVQSVDFSKLRYVAFGDSITAGSGLESKSMSYPYVVADILGTKTTNRGVGGSTLGYDNENLERHCIADDVVKTTQNGYTYDIISVTGGSNDKSLTIPLGNLDDYKKSSVYGALNIIADTLTKTYSNAFIFFMTPIKNPSCLGVNSAGYNLEDVSNAIKQVAEKYGIPVLDLFNTSQFENVDCGMNNPDCDGWHPLKEFVSDYLAPQITQFIKDNYKK